MIIVLLIVTCVCFFIVEKSSGKSSNKPNFPVNNLVDVSKEIDEKQINKQFNDSENNFPRDL